MMAMAITMTMVMAMAMAAVMTLICQASHMSHLLLNPAVSSQVLNMSLLELMQRNKHEKDMPRLAAKGKTVKTAVHTAAEEVVAPKKRKTLKVEPSTPAPVSLTAPTPASLAATSFASFEHGVVPATAGVPAGQPASQPPPETQAVKAKLSPQECRAKWAQYMRTFDKGDERRPSRTEKVPESLCLRIISEKDGSAWFPLWLDSGCSWGQVSMSEEFNDKVSDGDKTIDAWLTESHIEDLYKSCALSAGIVAEKKKHSTTWRPHPEVPHIKEAMQFLVQVSDEKRKEVERIHETGAKLVADLDASAGQLLLNRTQS
jgi:hypothetical protein